MNIHIITIGSRGDVQPYIALGKGLQAAGHAVTVSTCSSFETMITDQGLQYGHIDNAFLEMKDSADGRKVMSEGGSLLGLAKAITTMIKRAKEINRDILKDSWETAKTLKPDIILFHPKSLGGASIAEKLKIPAVICLPVPVLVPTGEFPPAAGIPDWNLGGGFNRFSYKLVHKGYHSFDEVINEFRQSVLGLEKLPAGLSPLHMTDGTPIPVLHAYSEQIWPRPADWPAAAHVTGYWFLDPPADWRPPDDLRAFLDAGEAPVYVGFGSMAGRNPRRMAALVIEALRKAKVRGIVATGWGGLDAGNLPETIFKIGQVPHAWLFPRMAAVIHHGGAGTTAAGLRAGKPSVICPFMIDQPIWAARVHALGAGVKPIPQKKLTAENLADAIREAVNNPSMREKAKELGVQIRGEDGVGKAVTIIEEIARAK